jgi:hypothetical protein
MASRKAGSFPAITTATAIFRFTCFADCHLLDAKLRRASLDAADGAVETVARRWPHVRILVRADSGFARDDLMAWCEDNDVHFLLGLAKNERLVAMIADELAQAEAKSRRTGKPARTFKEFRWLTRESWSRERRVIAKGEFTKNETNPRFVVTSLTRAQCKPKYLYEKVYCARGEMENRIKECSSPASWERRCPTGSNMKKYPEIGINRARGPRGRRRATRSALGCHFFYRGGLKLTNHPEYIVSSVKRYLSKTTRQRVSIFINFRNQLQSSN